jgi:hypothetical protein
VLNEKDASTFNLTVQPLSGALNTGLLLNCIGGARVKTSRNLEKKQNSFYLSLYAPKLADIRNFSKFASITVTRAILSYQYQPWQLRDSCAKVPSVSLILLDKLTISPFLDLQGKRAEAVF